MRSWSSSAIRCRGHELQMPAYCPVCFPTSRRWTRRRKFDGIRDQVGDDLLECEPVPSAAQGLRQVAFKDDRLNAASGAYDSTTSCTTWTKSTGSTCGSWRVAFIGRHRGNDARLTYRVHDVLNAFEATDHGPGTLLARDLARRRTPAAAGMHGISAAREPRWTETVACLEPLLQPTIRARRRASVSGRLLFERGSPLNSNYPEMNKTR